MDLWKPTFLYIYIYTTQWFSGSMLIFPGVYPNDSKWFNGIGVEFGHVVSLKVLWKGKGEGAGI